MLLSKSDNVNSLDVAEKVAGKKANKLKKQIQCGCHGYY